MANLRCRCKDARCCLPRRRFNITGMAHPDGIDLTNAAGVRRGFADFNRQQGRPALEDLWIMQGSLCDLKCKHCYTASSPLNDTLQQIRCDELRPHLDAARTYGV